MRDIGRMMQQSGNLLVLALGLILAQMLELVPMFARVLEQALVDLEQLKTWLVAFCPR